MKVETALPFNKAGYMATAVTGAISELTRAFGQERESCIFMKNTEQQYTDARPNQTKCLNVALELIFEVNIEFSQILNAHS